MPTAHTASRDTLTREQFLARHRVHGHEVDARLAVCLDCDVAFVDGRVVALDDDTVR